MVDSPCTTPLGNMEHEGRLDIHANAQTHSLYAETMGTT